MHCAIVKGDPPTSLQWLFNGRQIEAGDEHIHVQKMGEKVATLTIPSAKEEHAGEYVCMADSPAGRVTHSAQLKING